ncbi:MAG: Holliday junction resolvase RuvX [Pseudomonadota bacterium]
MQINTPKSLLAFDFGLARIGVAVGQTITGTARALATIQWQPETPDWSAIETLIDDWQPDLLLVGLPVNAEGEDTDQCAPARAFAAELGDYELPVQLIDEHLTSSEAKSRMREERQSGRRKKRIAKPEIDAMSAVLIAEQWLAERNIGRQF